MTKYGIRIVSSADGTRVPNAENLWLKFYDPEANDGDGGFEVTDDPTEALAYATHREAVEVTLRVSTERPSTVAGHLNRPVADAFHVEIEALPEAA